MLVKGLLILKLTFEFFDNIFTYDLVEKSYNDKKIKKYAYKIRLLRFVSSF